MACHPVIRAVRDGLQPGRFGTPRRGARRDRLRRRAGRPTTGCSTRLGGGALLDMGVYPLTFADLMLGPADRAAPATADAQRRAASTSTSRSPAGTPAARRRADRDDVVVLGGPRRIATDTGRVDLAPDFYHPTRRHVGRRTTGEPRATIRGVEPLLGNGLGNEAAEVQRCLAAGLRESPLVPHEQTLRIMRQMDDLRRQVGAGLPRRDAGTRTCSSSVRRWRSC